MIDVRMRDDQPAEVVERAAAFGQCVADSPGAIVSFARAERSVSVDAAVDERVAGRVGKQVGVDARNPVNTERQREEENSLSDLDWRHETESGQSRGLWQMAFR